MNSPLLLLLRRRGHLRDQALKSDDTGLLDTLTNVVGVMALITSLMSIFAAAGSLNIQAPMARRSQQGFHLLQASAAGIWDLQPAANQMLQADRERVAAVKRCTSLQNAPAQQQQCNAALDGWSRQQLVGPIRVNVSHGQGSLQRVGPPTVPAAQLKGSGSAWLDTTMAALARDKQAVFVVLESDGFSTYRAIKAKAQQHGVRLGWEPWNAGTAVNFWSNAGRSLTVQ
jgi:hypothetical protein